MLSVVIPTKRRTQDLFKCMNSLMVQTLLPDEIIIVDSGQEDEVPRMLEQGFLQSECKVKYLYSKVNLAEARNIGIRQSSGDVVFFFDDDVILDRNYIIEVAKAFQSDKENLVGGAMGKITNLRPGANSLKTSIKALFFLDHYGDGKWLPSGLPTWTQDSLETGETCFLSGCMAAYRRQVLEEFTFDPTLGKYSGYCVLEDVDMSARVSREYRLLYVPSARIEHHPSRVSRDGSITRYKELVWNHFYLFRKNTPKHLRNISAFVLSMVGILMGALVLEKNSLGILGWFQGISDIILHR